MKVCKDHIKTAGIPKRYLQIVDKQDCAICGLDQYFNQPNPCRKTEREIIQMYREKRIRA